MKQNIITEKCGWRVLEWAKAVGLSRASVYNLLDAGVIDSVKYQTARIIVTPPSAFLHSLEG